MESTSTEHPVGLYYSKESGQYIGAVDPTQANAYVHVGFELFLEGTEAAKMTDEQIADLKAKPAEQPESNKKGK